MVHEAAKYNIPSLVTSALGWMRVNVRDGRGRTALSIAAQHSGIEMVRLLLAQPGIDINIKDRDGRTALSYAMELDDLEVVEALLDRPDFKLAPNLESKYKLNGINGSTLDHVVRLQRLELLQMILEHPAVGCIDADALVGTALIHQGASSSASGTKTGNIIQLLMDSDKSITTVDLNKPRDFPRYYFFSDTSVMRIPPVLYFANRGNAAFIEVFQFLASQSQVRLDVSDDKGNGLIHIALDSMRSYRGEDQVDDLELLLAFHSLDVNALDGSGSPALTAALEVNVTAGVRLEVVRALLARPDLDINRRDKRGRHPVCYAAELSAWDVVDLLLNDERLATTTGDRKFIQERRPLPRPKGTPEPQWKPEPQRMPEPQRTPEPPAPQPITWPLYEYHLTHSLEAYLPLLHHRDAHGNTLLAHIAIHGWESALSLLLSQEDVAVNAPSAEGSLTPLMLALRHRHNGIARDLLTRQDLLINMRDAWGLTALAYAADRGIASLLKSCGATY
ncbi:ankyrin repeat-containing domain protein [Cladorrhinum sp. PSN259]|nr:ankyrin repeat-containing domain protein [Cladorrhinum sp. PSN259]